MEYPDLTEQHNRNATALALTYLRTQLRKQRFDVAPLDVGAGGTAKDQLKGALMLPSYGLHGTIIRY